MSDKIWSVCQKVVSPSGEDGELFDKCSPVTKGWLLLVATKMADLEEECEDDFEDDDFGDQMLAIRDENTPDFQMFRQVFH